MKVARPGRAGSVRLAVFVFADAAAGDARGRVGAPQGSTHVWLDLVVEDVELCRAPSIAVCASAACLRGLAAGYFAALSVMLAALSGS